MDHEANEANMKLLWAVPMYIALEIRRHKSAWGHRAGFMCT